MMEPYWAQDIPEFRWDQVQQECQAAIPCQSENRKTTASGTILTAQQPNIPQGQPFSCLSLSRNPAHLQPGCPFSGGTGESRRLWRTGI